MIEHYRKLIFIDLETTGPNPAFDRITEIGIVEVSATGVQRWSSLINPEVPIPPFIRQLTGIDDDMVRDAPLFESMVGELRGRLDGCLFIAHNARFDYGFLRNAFKRAGETLRCDVLCTVKMSRKLFPHEPRHSLDALVERHGLLADARHRALADADLLWQYWRKLQHTIDADAMQSIIRQLLQRPNLPEHLDPDVLDDIPDGPGVYVFHGEDDLPLYIGKAAQLRQRVLSHFHGDHPSTRDQLLARSLRRIAWHETLGDLGTDLLEARLARHLGLVRDPRHGLYAWQVQDVADGNLRLMLLHSVSSDFGRTGRVYGLFNTRQKAEKALDSLAEKLGLRLRRLEVAGGPSAASVEIASHEGQEERLELVLSALKRMSWPYPGPVTLHETCRDGRQDIHVIDNWCHLGTVHAPHEVRHLLEDAAVLPAFNADTYRVVSRAIASGKLSIHHVERATASAAPVS
ncbi:MAG TPA: exonuclease domain-containing protein [Noviherbaspirillum sp.]